MTPMLETGVASDDTTSVNGLVYKFYEADAFYESAVIDDSRLTLTIQNVPTWDIVENNYLVIDGNYMGF